MKKIPVISKFSIGAVALLVTTVSIACTCLDMGQFQDYAQHHPVVVRATIEKYGEELPNMPGTFRTMAVKVSEVVKGQFDHPVVEFFGDTGMSCLKYITEDDYPVDSEHLFILESHEDKQPLMVCGEASVRVRGVLVEGVQRGEAGAPVYTMPLEDLLSIITSQNAVPPN